MILFGAHDEHRQLDVVERQRAASTWKRPSASVIVEEQAAQILDMHARRQTRAVGIPGHQIEWRILLAKQIVADRVRPD